MAYDDDIKTKVRAFYECNDLSYAKVTEHFESIGYEVKLKTVQAWGGKEKWEKNKYKSMESAIEALLPPELVDSITQPLKDKIAKNIKDEINGTGCALEVEVIEHRAEAITDELLYKTLNKYGLQKKIVASLLRAENIAECSPLNMGVQATFHSMAVATVQTIHGKKVEMVPNDPNNKVHSDKALSEMTISEIRVLQED